MEDKSALLDQLRIDRTESAMPERSRWPLWLGCGAAVATALGLLAWRLLAADRATTAEATTATAIATTTSVTGSSLVVPASSSTLDASGYVVARRTASVSATIGGRVVEVLINEGSRVEKGQVVARLDDSSYLIDLTRAKAQLEQDKARLNAAQVSLASAMPIYERNEKQRAGGFISAQDFDITTANINGLRASVEVARKSIDVSQSAVTAAERNLRETVVRAPFAGVITQKNAQPGEIVSPAAAGGSIRTGIGTIVDMDSLEVEVDVSENFITRVTPGQPATVKLNAYANWDIPAEVIAVIPTADRAKATVKVRIGFKQKDPRILPEMGARVAFMDAGKK